MLKRWGKTELLGHAEALLRAEATHWQASRLGSSFSIYHRPVFAPSLSRNLSAVSHPPATSHWTWLPDPEIDSTSCPARGRQAGPC